MKKTILIFIPDHGYGHIARMTHLLQSLAGKLKEYTISVVSTQSSEFLSGINNINFIPFAHDPGLIQQDSLTIDTEASLKHFDFIVGGRKELLLKISNRLKGYEISGVISDTSFLGCWLASKLAVPVLLLGNFTWSDIYYDLSEVEPQFLKRAEAADVFYSSADYIIKLPLSTGMKPFREEQIKRIFPLIAAREIIFSEDDWERETGVEFSSYSKKVLLSFGGHDFDDLSAKLFLDFPDILFITTKAAPGKVFPNLLRIDSHCDFYQGIIKHSDAVITKPGYGIITDCMREKTPIIYTSRGRFAEYPVLKSFLDNNFPSIYISKRDLMGGKLNNSFEALFNRDLNFPTVNLNGAEEISNYFIREFDL